MITFAQAPDESVLSRLALSLDGIDVTAAIVAVDATSYRLVPVVPLKPGSHDLELYLLSPDQTNYTIVGQNTFEVAATDTNGLRIDNLTINADHEVAANSYRSDSSRYFAQSAGSVDGAVSAGSWSLTGQADYLAANKREARLTSSAIDIGQYAIGLEHQGENFTSQAQLGHQTFAGDDLLISHFNRRGASLGARSADGRFKASAFASRTNTSIGARNFTGLNDSDDRVHGAATSYNVLTDDDFKLSLGAATYEGRGTSFGSTETGEGHGVGATVRTSIFEDRATLQANFARTTIDHDADGGFMESEDGTAWGVDLTLQVLKPDFEQGLDATSLSLNAGYKKVDAAFFSFANPFETADHEDYTAGLSFAQGGLNLSAQGSHQTTNVEDVAHLPTDRLLSGQFNGSYSPFLSEPGPGWLGGASVMFGGQIGRTDRTDAPIGFVDPSLSLSSHQVYVGLSTYYDDWGWSLTESVSNFKDREIALSDRTDYLTDLSVNWTPDSRFNIDANVQWLRVDDPQTANADEFTFGLGSSYVFIPDTLTASGRYAATVSSENDAFEGGDLTAELNWMPRAGVTIALRGGTTHGDSVGPTADNRSDTYGSLVLRLSTPYSR